MPKLFGDRLKEIRISHNKTQTQVATDLGLSKSIISAYEKNLRTPSVDIIIKIKDYFGVPISYFLDEDNEDNYRLMVDLTDLTDEQFKIVTMLIEEFRRKNKKED